MTRDDAIFTMEYYKLHFASNEKAIEAFDMAIESIEQIRCLTGRPCSVCKYYTEVAYKGCMKWECVFKGV